MINSSHIPRKTPAVQHRNRYHHLLLLLFRRADERCRHIDAIVVHQLWLMLIDYAMLMMMIRRQSTSSMCLLSANSLHNKWHISIHNARTLLIDSGGVVASRSCAPIRIFVVDDGKPDRFFLPPITIMLRLLFVDNDELLFVVLLLFVDDERRRAAAASTSSALTRLISWLFVAALMIVDDEQRRLIAAVDDGGGGSRFNRFLNRLFSLCNWPICDNRQHMAPSK